MSPHKHLRKFSFALLFLVFNLITIKLFTNEVLAHTASVTTTGTVNLSVSASGNGANTVTDKVTVESSCPLGYTLSISGPNDRALYKDGDKTSTSKINASAGTKTNPASIIDNKNTWGYRILGVKSAGGPNGEEQESWGNESVQAPFIGLTNTATELGSSSYASTTGGDKYTLLYGASVDISTEPGQYKLAESTTGAGDNVITYYLTTNPACDTYAIRYNDNGANSPTKMGNQTVTSTNSDLTLWPSNFKHPDSTNANANAYGFAGWSTEQLDPDATDFQTKLTAAVAAGKVYGPSQTIPATDVESFLDNNITIENNTQYVDLYAVWVKSEGSIQNWQGCSAMNVGDIIALTDTRDNNTYAVAKLRDDANDPTSGKCWMIENLRLGGASPIALDSDTTNIANGTTFTLSASQDPIQSAWCSSTNAACLNQSMLASNNTTNTKTNMGAATLNNDDSTGIYSMGNYYNWYSATAGTGTYSITSGNTTGDICPAGWHLATGNTNGDFSSLDVAMGGTGSYQNTTVASNRWRTYPNNIIYSGRVIGSSLYYRGSYGSFWSSTADASNNAYNLYLDSSYVYPGTYKISKNFGFSARCVVSESYTVSFNSNGGSGDMASQTVPIDQATNLNSNAFVAPTGKQFVGWNTEANGSGTDYTNSQSITNLTTSGQTITLYAQWAKAPTAGYVTYDGNNNTSTFGMGNQDVSSETTTTLWAVNYAKTGYGFAGWSETKLNPYDPNFQTNLASAVSQNKVYGPNQDVTTSDVSGKVLYAIWVPVAKDQNDNELTFQTANLLTITLDDGTTLNAKSNGYVTALKDVRDNDVYAVAKLADGKYWMIENLRLGGTTEMVLDSSTTNIADGTTFTLPASQDPRQTAWCSETLSDCLNRSMLASNNTTNTKTIMDAATLNYDDGTGIYSMGNYYSWRSATAGTGTYSLSSGNATGDICPKGWHLSTGNIGGEFSALDSAMGGTGLKQEFNTQASSRWRTYPVNYIYSGNINAAVINNRGGRGVYWSSTASSLSSARNLNLGPSSVNPGIEGPVKYTGSTARCVIGG